jgi:hypothetical protein
MITQKEFTRRLNKLYNDMLLNPPKNKYAIKNIYARILSDIKIPQLDKRQLKDKEFKKEYMTSINMQLQSLERLQSLQRLERLESLQSLQRLESLESLQSLQRLESLQSLERLEGLQSLQRLETKLEFISKSMFDFDFSQYPIEDTIIYIDPPYEDTH